ncbi:MAG: SLBB domain-containing protein [Ignavibacteriaceae bacterium]
MLNKLFTVYYLILFIVPLFGQQLPDYQERFISDSLTQIRSLKPDEYSRGATEGIVNPQEHKVGPGDKFFISISGVTETINTLFIDQEGWLYIPKVGGIDLSNHSLADAKEKIRDAILKFYKDVDIFISLLDFRNIKVSLTGDVAKPSIFVLSANSRLIDIIAISEGFTETSDMRNILIISKDSAEKKYDFLSFLRFGDYSNNPILVEGDVVIIRKVDQIVQISGEIIYPALYEFREGETILDMIELAGGFTYKARKDSIELVTFVDNGEKQVSNYFSYKQLLKKDVVLKNKDHVMVRQIPEYLIDYFVKVDGYVKYPGWYRIAKDSTTLKDLIELAGGFLKEASLTEASIKRKMDVEEVDPEYERLKLIPTDKMTEDEYDYFKSKSRQSSGVVIVDFVKLFQNNNLDENIVLRKNDIINIPQKKDYIIMLGQFVNPGKIIFDSKLTIEDYIKLAGGFGWRALEGDVRVIKAKTGEWIDADEDVLLQPGDTIWVPEDPPGPKFWTVFTDVLTVVAQVAVILSATAAIIIATR